MTARTLNDIFIGARDRYAGRPAVMRVRDETRWHDIPFDAFFDRVRDTWAGLRQLSLAAGDRFAILSENRPEWAIADYACLAARVVNVPIYPTLTAHQMTYMLRDSGARGIFVSSARHLARILEIRGELPDLEQVVLFDGISDAPGVMTMAELEDSGRANAPGDGWLAEAASVTPDDIATVIYTSGTTGEPKGVMLSHGNIASNVAGALEILKVDQHDSYLSFLPLCHIFERMVGHYTMLQAGATISYSRGFDRVAAELPEARPTIVASVPRLYEKIHAAAVERAVKKGGLTRAIFEWACATGDKRLDYVLDRHRVPAGLAVGERIADALVFRKLRARFGGRVRFMVSGGAPLSSSVCRFFTAAGLPILEGYGLTETSPVIAFNRIGSLKPGTVGQVLPGVEVRIADDGEILTRGPHVMKGYFRKPEATAEAIDREGWFHTGDIGEFDSEGYLRITDRKKDLIKTSGGKYVAPQPIETMMRLNKFFANAVLLGDKRQYPIMLLVPDFTALDAWLRANGQPAGTPEDVVTRPPVRDMLEREARRSLRDLAHFEMPKKFLILPRDFSAEADEVTPTLKVKRRVVEAHYRNEIDRLYGGPA
ncbi:MAG: AMP-dependent synthetase/ligase [Gemmatimonadales bacterium]